DRLSAGLSSGNQSAMEQMLTGFVDRLQGGAGAQVNAVAENLSGLGQHLAGLQTGFSEAAARMTASAETMTHRMSDGAATLQARIDTQAEASAARMTAQVEAMVAELRELAGHSRSAGEEALTAVAAEVSTAARGFEAAAARVAESLQVAATATGGALGKGAEDAVQRIAIATEGMRAEIQAMMADLKTALGEAGTTLREGGAAGGTALQQGVEAAGGSFAAAVTGAADRLAQAGTVASEALEKGGSTAASLLGVAGSAIGERAEEIRARGRRAGPGCRFDRTAVRRA
ncbi:hypothetical protein, partial [Telmatospirillum sp.]|uniref:hypothetical protein n=1 Tax=Telmatospirillum sp. TaxID=2079197 RepID=UPI0028440BD8